MRLVLFVCFGISLVHPSFRNLAFLFRPTSANNESIPLDRWSSFSADGEFCISVCSLLGDHPIDTYDRLLIGFKQNHNCDSFDFFSVLEWAVHEWISSIHFALSVFIQIWRILLVVHCWSMVMFSRRNEWKNDLVFLNNRIRESKSKEGEYCMMV